MSESKRRLAMNIHLSIRNVPVDEQQPHPQPSYISLEGKIQDSLNVRDLSMVVPGNTVESRLPGTAVESGKLGNTLESGTVGIALEAGRGRGLEPLSTTRHRFTV